MCAVCDGASLEHHLETHRRTVEEHGISYAHVEADASGSGMSYSVGLTRYDGHPELLVSGLDCAVSGIVLECLAHPVMTHDRRYRAGEVVAGLGPLPLRLVPVNRPQELAIAQALYAEGGAGVVPALQVVWPDDAGRWPGDPRRRRPRPMQLFGPATW